MDHPGPFRAPGVRPRLPPGRLFPPRHFGLLGCERTQVGDVPFYLADYRGSSLQLVSNWTTVSLSPLAGATSLAFSLTSTDVGQFGMNTPAYFAVDNLIAQTTAVPEPSSWLPCLIGCGVSLLASRMPKVFLTSKPALNREELCPC